MAEQEENRTEKATPFKLREARRKGQVPKSIEVNSMVLLVTVVMGASLSGEKAIGDIAKLCAAMISNAHDVTLTVDRSLRIFEYTTYAILSLFGMFIITVTLAGVMANMVQTGPIFSFHPLKPDFKRLDPVAGFKRLFSRKMLFEAGKNVVKVCLFGAGLTVFLRLSVDEITLLTSASPKSYPFEFFNRSIDLALLLVLMFLLVAAADWAFSRWYFASQMRMSTRELKEEHKRREGDPQIRSTMRRLHREKMKRRRGMSRVKDADVIITNPVRLAIALQYRNGEMPAPALLAKGAGQEAKQIRKIGLRHRIPIVTDKKLARRLFREVEVDSYIAPALYGAVAKALVAARASKVGVDAGNGG